MANKKETQIAGAHLTLVQGLISDAGRLSREKAAELDLFRCLDAAGAVPRRGEEDDGVRDRRGPGMAAARGDRLSDRRRHGHSGGCGRRSMRWNASAG